MFCVGQVVYSKCGRDRGYPFLIHHIDGEYVFLVDGERHELSKPKKKKDKHVQMTKEIDLSMQDKLQNKLYVVDADIRKALAPHQLKGDSRKEATQLVKE